MSILNLIAFQTFQHSFKIQFQINSKTVNIIFKSFTKLIEKKSGDFCKIDQEIEIIANYQ
jgi:hypothetical protein